MRRPLSVVVGRILAVCWPALLDSRGQAQTSPSSGLDRSSFDAAVRPQDDLYRHVNGRWLADAEMPADRVTYGTFMELADRADLDVRAIVEELAAQGRQRPGSPAQQIGDLYASMMDEGRLEALGDTPIRPELDRIEALRPTADVAAEA